MLNIDPITMVVVKMILGKGHLEDKEYFRMNSDIVSCFLASVLDIWTPKGEAKALVGKLFKKILLGGLDETMKATFLGRGIPRARDLEMVKIQG